MKEIMMIRNDIEGRSQLRIFQVDDATLSKLTRIRGTLYQDDPRLRIVKDLPTPEPKKEITSEMQARADAAYQIYLAEKASKNSQSLPIVKQPEPPKILSFEEQVIKDWRTRPDIRSEFISLASYEAYCRAVQDGRCRAYGHE